MVVLNAMVVMCGMGCDMQDSGQAGGLSGDSFASAESQ